MATAPSIQTRNNQRRSGSFRWRIAQFFELRWWRFYLRKQEKSEYLAWKLAYWQHFLEKSGLQVPANAMVLDAGCGPAGIFMALSQAQVTAIDPLLKAYAEQLQHFSESDWPHVQFAATMIEHFVPERPFDIVFCLNAINHVADLPACIERLVALTKQGGTLAVSVDAHNYQWLKWLFQRQPSDILHPHQYDLQEYSNMFTNRGCTLQRVILYKKEWIFSYHLLVFTHHD
jgi:2-polyprenyl-3-methyl-5-hydroxy-6-metoxy-1,4-benzoquinol methylase